MTMEIREYISFAGELFDIESTMDYVRMLYAIDGLEQDVYTVVMSILVELRAGYPYEDDEMINGLDGGYVTYRTFFETWGTGTIGGYANPIDLTFEEEKKEETDIIDDDLVSELTFFSEIDEMDIMNDDIGEFEPLDEVEIEKFTW